MIDARRRMVLLEIELQCTFALKAYGSTTAALEHHDAETFWYSLQALLGAAAHLHRFLEGDPELRAAAAVPDTSPLMQNGLDCAADVQKACIQWLDSRPKGPLRPSNFGSLGFHHPDPSAFARFFDPDRSLLVWFGGAFDLPELLAAIANLSERVKEALRQLRELN